jgi:hypothetical protein
MERLKQALLNLQIASVEEIEDACARQQVYGSDLLTNLLEVRSVTETSALEALAAAYGLPTMAPGPLPLVDEAALHVVPRAVLMRFEVYPVAKESEHLIVAAGRPLTPETLAKLAAAAGCPVRVILTLPARVQQAQARDAGSMGNRRLVKTIARLEGAAALTSSRAPNPLLEAPPFTALPRPQSFRPGEFLANWSESETPRHDALLVETAQQPAVSARDPQSSAANRPSSARRDTDGPYRLAPPPVPSPDLYPGRGVSSKPVSSNTSEPSRRGPYAIAQARRDLGSARTPDQVLRIAFTYTTQYFDFLAAFTIRGDEATLKGTRGLPDSKPETPPLNVVECIILSDVVRTQRVQLAPVGKHPSLAKLLGLSPERYIAAMPIGVGARTPIVLVGGFDSGQPTHHHAKQATELSPLVAYSLERIIRERKSRPPGS